MMSVSPKPIKLLAIDLDGTVVNDDLSISAPLQAALSHLIHNTDIKVVVATGRMHPSALIYAEQIGTPLPVVSYQGGMICKQNAEQSILYHEPISKETALKVVEYLQHEKYSTNIYINNKLFTNHDNPHATLYAKLSGITPKKVRCLLKHITDGPTKLMTIDDERIDDLVAGLEANFGDTLTVLRSRSNFCEMIAPTASKWNAVKHLADQWGIDAHEIMACGDQGNDVSMLSAAGIGVAMGNAPDVVKGHADFITKSIDEDGVLHAINTFILNT